MRQGLRRLKKRLVPLLVIRAIMRDRLLSLFGLYKKPASNDYKARINDALADPNNRYIPRIKDAGKVIGDYQIMHNGLKVGLNYYSRRLIPLLLERNKGVHEPQEERVFMEVLRHIPKGGTIVELGSYWAYYSMWFCKEIENARAYMIEPNPTKLEEGKKNFALNRFKGDFTLGEIGKESQGARSIKIDDFAREKHIEFIDILHSDIQGHELEMLHSAEEILSAHRIGYLFISTHNNRLHRQCTTFLKNHGYNIIASADFDYETYCYDGVLVASSPEIKVSIPPIKVRRRPKFCEHK